MLLLPLIGDFGISIHALLAEGDQILCAIISYMMEFQSTPSSRRATMEAVSSASRF